MKITRQDQKEWDYDYQCTNYYNEPLDTGCCLKCSNAEEGCLCFQCKCTKCSWYGYDSYNGGYCKLPRIWKAKRQDEWNKATEHHLNIFSRVGLKKEQKQIGDFHDSD